MERQEALDHGSDFQRKCMKNRRLNSPEVRNVVLLIAGWTNLDFLRLMSHEARDAMKSSISLRAGWHFGCACIAQHGADCKQQQRMIVINHGHAVQNI